MGAMTDYQIEQAQKDADDQERCEVCGSEMNFILGEREQHYFCEECNADERSDEILSKHGF